MRCQLSLLPFLCLSIGAACSGDDPRTESLDGGAACPALFTTAACGGGDSGPAPLDASGDSGPVPLDAGGGDSGPASLDAGGGACPAKFTTASYMRMPVSWPGSIGFLAAQDYMQAWAKTTFVRTADGMTTESVLCGVVFPIVSTTILLGQIQLANDFPLSAFDQPTMPRAQGRATWQGGRLVVEVGAAVLGTTLSDLNAAWPTREALMPADHDGDGKPGMTLIPRKDPPFGLPPGDILMTTQLDAMYTASRMSFRLTGTSEGCRAPESGELEPIAFNYTVVGCHIAGGSDCGERELNLVENQSPVFTPMSGGRWKSVPIAESASCAEVRNAAPAE